MKIAQINHPLINTPIDSEQLIKGIWNKYFAQKHNNIVQKIKTLAQSNDKLKMAVERVFPLSEDFWKTFAYMPLTLSLQEINDGVARLTNVPELKAYSDVMEAINLFQDQYKMMLNRLMETEHPKQPKPRPKQRTGGNADKIKTVQRLLQLPQTGAWDEPTNNTFLKWLNEYGWGRFILPNGRFKGNLDAAIDILSASNLKPEVPNVPIEQGLPEIRRANRQKRLKELFS